MAELPERLQEVMLATGWTRADLMRVTGMSSSVVSQWLGHGSKSIATIGDLAAAINIERESGFSALWVAKGIGDKMAHRAGSPGLHVREPASSYLTPEKTLAAMASLLSNVTPELRRTVGDLLRGWAEDGGDPARIPALLAVLQISETAATGLNSPKVRQSLRQPRLVIAHSGDATLTRVEAIDKSWGLF